MGSGVFKSKKKSDKYEQKEEDGAIGDWQDPEKSGTKKKKKKTKKDKKDKKGKKKTEKGKSKNIDDHEETPDRTPSNEYFAEPHRRITIPPQLPDKRKTPQAAGRAAEVKHGYSRESAASYESEYETPRESQIIGSDDSEYTDVRDINGPEDTDSIPDKPAPLPEQRLALERPSQSHTVDNTETIYDDVTVTDAPEVQPRVKRGSENRPALELPAAQNVSPHVEDVKSQTPVKPPVKRKPSAKTRAKTLPTGIRVVVAIDFGTTFTGYCYSHIDTKDDVKMNPNWTGGKALSYKTPTCVVINDATGEVEAFGYEAHNVFFSEDREPNLSYYKEFKLDLMKQGLSETTELSGEYGRPITALDLFAKVLKFLKDRITEDFMLQGNEFRMSNIRWVLTVPAIWEDPQKLFMRLAAKQAGLIQNTNADNLLIALEPEAASLYCRSLKMGNFQNCRGDQTLSLKPGTIYIVVDAGGGTIDITVHKVLEGGKVAEIHHARGGPWGGSKVNGRFELKLQSILGEAFVKHCKKTEPEIWLELLQEFEQAKQSDAAKPNSEKTMRVRMGFGLSSCYKEFANEEITEAFQRQSTSGITASKKGSIDISPENVRNIFHTVVIKTTDLLSKLLQDPKIAPATDVFIVGGFGQCPYMKEEIKKLMDTMSVRKRVLIPEEGNLSILRGAVMFGHQTDFITERVSKKTYAYKSQRLFNPDIDGDKEPFESSSGLVMVQYLEPIIKKGEHIKTDEEIIKEFEVDEEEFNLDLYSSDDLEVDDPDSDTVTHQGSLKIFLPASRRQSENGTNEEVQVTFTLGTELKVKGRHLASGTTTETTLTLLT